MNNSKAVYKVDKFDMSIVAEYPTARKASRENGLRQTRVSEIARDRLVDKGRYIYRYKTDYDPNESFEGKKNRPVLIGDFKTGQKFAACCIQEAAEFMPISISSIQHAVLDDDMLIWGRYKIKYLR